MATKCNINYKGKEYSPEDASKVLSYHYAVKDAITDSQMYSVKDGVDFVFEQNPQIAEIGTPEQYSQYVDSIFPDSKVKDIVYHGSSAFGFQEFSKEKLGTFTGAGSAKLGFFFSNSQENSFAAYTQNINKDVSFGDDGSTEGIEGTFGLAQLDSIIENIELGGSFTDNKIRNKEYYVKATSNSGGVSYGVPFKTKKQALDAYKNDDWNYNPDDKVEVIEDYKYGQFIYNKVDWLKDQPIKYYKKQTGTDKEILISEEEYTNAFEEQKKYLISERKKLIKRDSKTRVYSIILNSTDLKEFNDEGKKWREESYVQRIQQTFQEKKDGLVIKNTYDPLLNDVYVVFEPEQIHILGSQKDIEGFKSFVDNNKGKSTVSTQEKINKANQDYGNGFEIATLNEDGSVEVDVNPIAGDILASEDTGVSESIDTTVESSRYVENLDVDEVTLDEFNSMASQMEQRFAELGITSHIIFDGDLDGSGELLGTGTEKYRDLVSNGEIGDGDAVIIVNPRNLFKDTVHHEYAHIFIDMLGGMDNPRIKYAYSKIKNSTLANEVREKYPELTGEELDKEIMATAIGKEASGIGIAEDANRSYFDKFLQWLRDGIRSLMGLSNDNVKTLSNTMLKGDVAFTGSLSATSQQFKDTFKSRQERASRLRAVNNAELTTNKLKARMQNLIRSLGKSEDVNKSEFRETLKTLQNEMEVYSDADNLLAIDTFIGKSLDMSQKLLKTLQDEAVKDNPRNIQINFETLNQIELFNSLMSVIGELETMFSTNRFQHDYKKFGWGEKEQTEFKDKFNQLENTYRDLEKLKIEIGIHHIANKLVPYSNKITVTRRIELEKEFNEIFEKKPNETPKQYRQRRVDYINEKISEEKDTLKSQERDWIYERLKNSPADIGGFAALVSSEKDLNSMVIQMASKLLDEADLRRDMQMQDIKLEAARIFHDFDKATRGMDPKEKYKGLYQESKDGQLYITGEYDIEFYTQYQELTDAIRKEEDKNPDSIEAAAARNAKAKWLAQNTVAQPVKGTTRVTTPIDKWKNKDYASIMKDKDSPKAKMLEFLIRESNFNHKRLHGNNSLIKTVENNNAKFILAPSIGRSTFEKAVSGNIIDNIKDSLERTYKAKTDDTDLIGQVDSKADIEDVKKGIKVMQDSKGNIRYGVPIHFRNRMTTKDISYDLMSSILLDSYMAINYMHKSSLQVELEMMRDITANKHINQTTGWAKNPLLNQIDKKGLTPVDPLPGSKSNEYKVLESIIENRLYGIKTINTEMAKFASTLMSWTASSMLIFNLPSGVVNAIQGKVFNFIEGAAGEFFNTTNLKNAESHYFRDMKGWMNDIGRPVSTAKTNQLMELLNIQGEFKALGNKFIENNRFKALAKKHTGFAFNHIGEHYMHSTLMYAVLDKIKAMDENNNYIDINGKIVKTADKAMTLAEAFTVDEKTQKLTLNKHIRKTSFGNSTFTMDTTKGKGILELKQLINKLAHDMHGNYNEEIQSMGQRYIVGKMMFMLRKWMIPGFNRRWRGAVHELNWRTDNPLDVDAERFYSEDLQAFQEGYYTTGLRFMKMVLKDFKTLQFEVLSKDWNKLSDTEKANMRRLGIELGIMAFTFISAMLLKNLAEGMDDPWEREALFHMTYYTRRIYSELRFYSNPIEAFKIMSSPAASMSYVVKMGKFIDQALGDMGGIIQGEELETYATGRRKGDLKLWKKTVDLLPGANQYYRDMEESTGWLFNVY
jgi:hypothetical protein